MSYPIWLRILVGVVLLAFLVWKIQQRWKSAGEASEARSQNETRSERCTHSSCGTLRGISSGTPYLRGATRSRLTAHGLALSTLV
jgi:hypothetical protein